MNSEHRKILAEITRRKGKGTKHSDNDSYISSGHHYYDVSVPERRMIAKEWLARNKAISDKEFIEVIDYLYAGKSHEEKTIASHLLGYHPEIRRAIGPKELNHWLDHLVGWAEIDTLCQNVFTARELLDSWREWELFIPKLSKDKNINKRRAALVFLVGPVYYSDDKKIARLAFAVIDTLKHERAIIITKAISWLLRIMVKHHPKQVSEYLEKNKNILPKVAIRETLRKIKTGRK